MELITTRIPLFVGRDRLQSTLRYYETLLGRACGRQFDAPGGLTVAMVDPVCLIAAVPETLNALPPVAASLQVGGTLEAWAQRLAEHGAEVLQPPADSPIGRNLYARNPDGSIFELLEMTGR